MVAAESTSPDKRKVVWLVVNKEGSDSHTIQAVTRANIVNEHVVLVSADAVPSQLSGSNDRPHLILIDHLGGGTPTLGALDSIRDTKSLGRVPVVCMIDADEVDWSREAYQRGVTSIVRKPKERDALGEAVLQIMMYWLLLNALPSKMD